MSLVVVCLLLGSLLAQKVYPPHWWVGMRQQEVQVMIHRTDVAASEVRVDYPGVTLLRTTFVENQIAYSFHRTNQHHLGFLDLHLKFLDQFYFQ